jgi:8-oxo-dGTP diphosphatase
LLHRIRAAALIPSNGRILLVEGEDAHDGVHFAPPGGGLEAFDASIPDCVHREVFEETGLTLGELRLVYWREFHHLPSDTLNLEMYFLVDEFHGEPTTANLKGQGDEDYVKGLRWFTRQELASVKYFPAILGNDFWFHLEQGFPGVQYLGREQG